MTAVLLLLMYLCIAQVVTLVSFFFTTGSVLSDNRSYVLGLVLGLVWPLTLLITIVIVVRRLVYCLLNKIKS